MTGAELKTFRLKAGMSQKDLAEMLGVSQQSLYYYENKDIIGTKLEVKIKAKLLDNADNYAKDISMPNDNNNTKDWDTLNWFWKLRSRKEYFAKVR